MEIKTIKNFDELIGKTICNYHVDRDELYLRFTDDTVALIEMDDVSEPYRHGPKYEVTVSSVTLSESSDALLEMGVVSKEAHTEANRLAEEKWERERAKLEKEEKERQTKQELEVYLQLKEKLNL
jgi:hypothetical protein